jgi:hypothetical protein
MLIVKKKHASIDLVFTYQNHISETASAGKQADPNFQINLITDLEIELKSTFEMYL